VEQALLGVECHPNKARQVHLELGLELLQVTHLGAIFSVQVQQHLVQGLQPPCNLGLEGLGNHRSLDLGSKPWEVHWEHLVRQDKWGLVCPAHLEVGWELQLVVEVLQVLPLEGVLQVLLLVEVLQELHLLVDLEVLHQALLEWLEVEVFRHLVATKVQVVDLGLLLVGEFPGLVAPQPRQPLHPSSHK